MPQGLRKTNVYGGKFEGNRDMRELYRYGLSVPTSLLKLRHSHLANDHQPSQYVLRVTCMPSDHMVYLMMTFPHPNEINCDGFMCVQWSLITCAKCLWKNLISVAACRVSVEGTCTHVTWYARELSKRLAVTFDAQDS